MRTTLCLVLAVAVLAAANPLLAPPLRALHDVDPCEDFFTYACGSWIANTTLPPSESIIIKSFSTVEASNNAIINSILTSAPATTMRVGRFYANCMDLDTIEAYGYTPLLPYWAQVSSIQTVDDFLFMSGTLQSYGIPALFSLSVVADAEQPTMNIADFGQGGFSLPDRSLYLDDSSAQLRTDYVNHMSTMFQYVIGRDMKTQTDAMAQQVMAFETMLATAALDGDKIRDPYAVYNKIDLDGLAKITPGLEWSAFLKGVGAPDITQINVDEPAFFSAIAPKVLATDINTLRSYLQWQLLHNTANYLSSAFVNETFNFFTKELQGQSSPTARNLTCQAATDAALGDELGPLFIAQAFPGNSKEVISDLVDQILSSFGTALTGLTWMDPITLAQAQKKLSLVRQRVGYPNTWKNYTGYDVIDGQYFESTMQIQKYLFASTISQVGQPANLDAWSMTTQTVNAYYDPLTNSINFPAAILQNPFFSAAFDAAVNFGSIGAVMGHELSHGFDDQGRNYDGTGKLTNWWQNSTLHNFEERAQCLATQYSGFNIDGAQVNGNLTLGENIADNSGVHTSFRAYQSALSKVGKKGTDSNAAYPNYTNNQAFFYSYAQLWCAVETSDFARLRTKTDVHSPPKFRIIGVLQNSAEFSDAFKCNPGSYMNPANKCVLY